MCFLPAVILATTKSKLQLKLILREGQQILNHERLNVILWNLSKYALG